MTRHRFIPVWVLLPVLAGALLFALAAPAAAQREACVHLQVGSSYGATMSIVAEGGGTVETSPPFTVPQTVCLPLDPVADGVGFSVVVAAESGETAVCTPSNIPRAADSPVAVTYLASGTPLNVHCDAPTGATRL
jgi:hypothetical protein